MQGFDVQEYDTVPTLTMANQLEMISNAAAERQKTLHDARFIRESLDKINDLSPNSTYGSSGASDAQNDLQVQRERKLESSKTERDHSRHSSPNTYNNNLRFYGRI